MTTTAPTADPHAKAAPKDGLVNYKSLAICLAVGLSIWFSPRPEGLVQDGAWQILAIFVTTILGLILKPLPMGGVAIVSMVVSILTNTITAEAAFNGFSNKTVWLVVFALFIAKGFEVTGLGKRIAYYFTYLLGKSTLGLSYGMVATDFILAPAIPSVTGRMGGIVFPILKGIANSYQSFPFCQSSRKMAGFLTVVAMQGTVITSAMFLTAMAANPIVQEIVNIKAAKMDWGIPEITWGTWALASIVPGLCSLILMPLVVYWLYPPTVKRTPDAPKIAHEQLQLMGRLSLQEWIMASTVILLLGLWIFGKQLGVAAVVAAMVGVCILMLTRVLDWKNLVKMDGAWETFVWFCVLIMLAKSMEQYGVIRWFSDVIELKFSGLSWQLAFPLLALIYFYSHYFFASATAHVLAMFPPFLAISVALGTPPMLASLVMIFISALFGGITHYSLAPAPLLYSAGYVDIKDWWRIGFLVSMLNIVIWGTIGLGWWKILGFW